MSRAPTRIAQDVLRAAVIDLTGRLLAAAFLAAIGGVVWLVVSGGSVPAWAALLAVIAVALALMLYHRGLAGSLRDERDDAAWDAAAFGFGLERHETYSRHVAQALDALQRVVSGDIGVPIPHYIEQAILEPARDLIAEKPTENVRLSILLPRDNGERWWMPWGAGHTVTGKAKYNERIVDTLSRPAFETGEPQYWPDVKADSAYRPNPKASAPIRTMASLPIRAGDQTLGVLNIVSSEPDAFDPAEDTNITSLRGVIAVAVSVYLKDAATRGSSG
jgi:GAF domain-containing protein